MQYSFDSVGIFFFPLFMFALFGWFVRLTVAGWSVRAWSPQVIKENAGAMESCWGVKKGPTEVRLSMQKDREINLVNVLDIFSGLPKSLAGKEQERSFRGRSK